MKETLWIFVDISDSCGLWWIFNVKTVLEVIYRRN